MLHCTYHNKAKTIITILKKIISTMKIDQYNQKFETTGNEVLLNELFFRIFANEVLYPGKL